MKMFQILLTVAVAVAITACGDSNKTTQNQKALADKLLRGEPVTMKDLPTQNKWDYRHPVSIVRNLGYSEEDLKKLGEVVVMLPKSKPTETPIPAEDQPGRTPEKLEIKP